MSGAPRRASWLDLWLDATRWWTAPALVGAQGLADMNIRILAEVVDGLMRRLEGQRVELIVDGRPTTAVLELIRLRRSGGRYRGRLVLRDVVWDGLPIKTLAAVAGSVRLEPFPSLRLTLSEIEIAGRSPIEPLVGWLNARAPRWRLSVDGAGHVEARRRRGRLAAFGTLVVADHRLQVHLRGLRWRRLRVRVPGWLRVRRTIALPALPNAMSIVEAHGRRRFVDFRARVPSISRRLDAGS